jgi:hypothetical protein
MFRAYKFRLWTNSDQERELSIMLETHRRLYNAHWLSVSGSTTNGRSGAATKINRVGLRTSALKISGLPESTSAVLKAHCAGWIKLSRTSFDASKPVRN